MDKLLISTFFALMAGFIAAAMSFVKLVNDKENRITDYREVWSNSVRRTLADMVAHINSISNLLASRVGVADILEKISNDLTKNQITETQKELLQHQLDHYKGYLETIKNEITNLHKELNQTYNFARLHFKQNDRDFSIIEAKFDNVKILITELSGTDIKKVRIAEIQGKLEIHSNDIIVASRGIMKFEWERIKKGELTYQKTKNVAKWGGAFILFILFTVAIHAAISGYREHDLFKPEDKVKQNTSRTDQSTEKPQPSAHAG